MSNFPFKTKPYDHQLKEFELFKRVKSRCLFWEMGCVDGETEYLTPTGWKRIDTYAKGDLVTQWNPETGKASFIEPKSYVVKDCQSMYRFKSARGLDQMLSPEHRVPLFSRYNREKISISSAEEIVDRITGHPSINIRLPSRFTMDLAGEGIALSDWEIRLQVAILADGSFPKHAPNTKRCEINLKKERKKSRLVGLLKGSNTPYDEKTNYKTGYSRFVFQAPMRIKRFPLEWWTDLTNHQRSIILDEIFHWDGTVSERRTAYFTGKETDADFIQFLLATTGKVVGKCYSKGWQVQPRKKNTKWYILREENISIETPINNRKYCFEVPSGFLIFRRNGNIFPSGNTGKSKPVIDQAAALFMEDEIDAALVLAPNGVHQNWIEDELPTHMIDQVQTPTFIWESKRRKTKTFQAEYAAFNEAPGLPWLAITYDAIMTDDCAKAVRKYLDSQRVFYVADETTFIKTPGAKRTMRVIASGRHAEFTRVLNGTPVSDSPFHAYSQVRFSDPDFWKKRFSLGSFTEFKSYFGIWEQFRRRDGHQYPQLIRYRNLNQLHEALDEVGSRILKDDVLDLPPKVYNKIYYQLSPAQKKLYEELKRDFIAWFGDGSSVTAELAIVRMTRMQQICSGYLPADDEKDLRMISDELPRLKLLMETLETVPRQALIWAKYDIDIDTIAQALKRAKIPFVTYDGRTSSADRQKAKDDFKAGRAKIFLGKPSAAGRGLTLTAADTVIFYNNNFVLDDRLQAEDRAHRITQDRKVNYIDLVAAGTVDEYILKILREKRRVSAYVMGDELPPWI